MLIRFSVFSIENTTFFFYSNMSIYTIDNDIRCNGESDSCGNVANRMLFQKHSGQYDKSREYESGESYPPMFLKLLTTVYGTKSSYRIIHMDTG